MHFNGQGSRECIGLASHCDWLIAFEGVAYPLVNCVRWVLMVLRMKSTRITFVSKKWWWIWKLLNAFILSLSSNFGK